MHKSVLRWLRFGHGVFRLLPAWRHHMLPWAPRPFFGLAAGAGYHSWPPPASRAVPIRWLPAEQRDDERKGSGARGVPLPPPLRSLMIHAMTIHAQQVARVMNRSTHYFTQLILSVSLSWYPAPASPHYRQRARRSRSKLRRLAGKESLPGRARRVIFLLKTLHVARSKEKKMVQNSLICCH